MLIGFLSGLFGCKAPPPDGVWKTLGFSQTGSNDSQCFFFEAKRTEDDEILLRGECRDDGD